MRTVQIPRILVAALATAFSVGCKGPHGTAVPAQSARRDTVHSDSAGGLVVAPDLPYVPVTGGRGTIVIDIAADSTRAEVRPAGGPCDVAASSTPLATDGVYWIDGIRQGKPLPEDRRYELVSAACTLTPRMQAVVIGGAIDVVNDDAVIHRLVFIRAGTNDTLQTMPFTNDGQVVATDRLTRTPGIIEVRCAQHPQERAYIAVFDHPYFRIGSAGEHVTLDSIPPGDYQVLTWREGMAAPTAIPAKVGPRGQTHVVVQ